MRYPFLLLLLLTTAPVLAQESPPVLLGRVVDADDGQALVGVTVLLTPAADSTRQSGTITAADGSFLLRTPAPGAYRLRFSFVGYLRVDTLLTLTRPRHFLDTVRLRTDPQQLGEVVVEATQQRVEMRGDTTVFNADAYKVNPDANAEDLVAKMPGVVIENGQVQAQGEQVRRVTVDGEEFFGDDAVLALRNMPAEIIEKVEVFDRMSEQAQFTGFNDGETEKTINIVTRPGMNNGQFGNAYGGYGTDQRYRGGGNVSLFDGARRISVIGLTNNVNQQNFATEDLLGVVGSTGGGGRGGGRGGRGGRGGGDRGSGRGGSSNPGDFLIGDQSGVSLTNAVGLNYSDRWGEKVRVNGAYFFNQSDNTSDAFLNRAYVVAAGAVPLYSETATSESDNLNHRLSGRVDITLDERNSILIRPRLSFQRNDATSTLSGSNALSEALESLSANRYTADNAGFTSSTNVLFRHSFPTRGRTLSLDLGLGLSDRSGDTEQQSLTTYYAEDGTVDEEDVLDQRLDDQQRGRTYSARLSYTEPIGESGQLRLDYRPSYADSDADRRVYATTVPGTERTLDPAYSSLFDNTSLIQRGGVSYRLRGEKFNASLGIDVQEERLQGAQTYPTAYAVDERFQAVLPSAMLSYRFSPTNNLRLFYRIRTETPSASQLQDVVNNANPLQLTGGNPDLRPSFSNTAFLRWNATDVEGGRVFIAYASLTQTRDYIGNATLYAQRDIVLPQGVTIPAGAQFTQPVNLDGYWNARTLFNVGFPFAPLKSNLNVNVGGSFTRAPGQVDREANTADVYGLNGGIVLGSNISERLDFTLSYGATWTTTANSAFTDLDTEYTRHNAGVRFIWLPWRGLVLDTNLTGYHYAGLDPDLYPSTVLWNVGMGYKFLPGNAGELKLMVSDVLDESVNVNRTVTERYVEDTETNVLGRYVMLNFTYRLRNFGFGR